MKILTLNLAGYRNWEERERTIASFIDASDADVLLFQEVKYDAGVSPLSQVQLLNSKLDVAYPYSQSVITRSFETNGVPSREGLAVLSRFPITDAETLVLATHVDDKHVRIVQNFDIIIGDTMQKFTNIHFSNNQYSNEQLEELLTILTRRGEKRIIVGDFNMYALDAVQHLYRDNYTDSTTAGNYVTFPSENVRLDYALIPNEYTFSHVSVHEGLSDHNALLFEV